VTLPDGEAAEGRQQAFPSASDGKAGSFKLKDPIIIGNQEA
jgi:hypothetical protein